MLCVKAEKCGIVVLFAGLENGLTAVGTVGCELCFQTECAVSLTLQTALERVVAFHEVGGVELDTRLVGVEGQRAVQYVRYFAEDFGIDPDKIALCGFSAGGHLSVMVAEHPVTENLVGDVIGEVRSTPDACILAYPVTTLGEGTFETMPRIFLGENLGNAEETAKYSYPHAIDTMPPTFVFYSVKDQFVNFEANSIAFADAMTAAGRDVTIAAYEDGGHGIGLGTQYNDYSRWHADSAAFLENHGF